jgi:hypothetical protein
MIPGGRPMLDGPNLIPYLLECGYLTPEQVLQDPLEVVETSRRNRNFAVRDTHGNGLMVKHGVDPDRRATLAREASAYRLLSTLPGLPAITDVIPPLLGYDVERSALLLGLLEPSESLFEYQMRTGRVPSSLSREVGNALGLVHAYTSSEAARERCAATLGRRLPDSLLLHCPTFHFLTSHASHANLLILRAAQSDTELFSAMDRLGDLWTEECLIHGDFRWDNIVVTKDLAAKRVRRVALVDWELACLGDPAWDVGCAMGEYLAGWLHSTPIDATTPPEIIEARSRLPLVRMRPAIHAFWDAYRSTTALSTQSSEALLDRAVRYMGARLLQVAWEITQGLSELSSTSIYALQLAANVLARPNDARSALGLEIELSM